jgi:Kef-type K+ transport system membrane component KefB
MVDVDTTSFLVIVGGGGGGGGRATAGTALSSVIATVVGSRFVLPVVVVEIVLGIIVGPDVLKLVDRDAFVDFFSNLGLGMLFFFAGYEIDFRRVRGSPLRTAAWAWLLSLAIAYAAGGLLSLAGIVLSLVFVGSAMATTAIGTLIPILSDAGEMKTRFGTYLLAGGAVGEFGPILLITLVFSTKSALDNAAILIAFVVLAVLAGIIAVRSIGRSWDLLEKTLETSSQLAVRVSVLVVFALVALAATMGLDILLGGFVAGIILRLALQGREVRAFESKLVAVGYGFLIPFFFVTSGVNFDLQSLLDEPLELYKLPMFLALFLLVRGAPALLLYRGVLDARDRAALAFFSATELPLVVAITTIAVSEGHMRSETAASLVGAAVLSTAIYPLVGLRLRGDRASAADAEVPVSSPGSAPSPPRTPRPSARPAP